MHGSSPGLALIPDTEVAYMGGIVENGVGSDTKTSPRRAAIEKAQEELRQEYDVREERRRELEFLEKGGNPLDFKFGHGASISLQSTSLTDQLAEHYVISEAKGSFALAPSPHGDSVESSGRPGGSVSREPNTADNLLLLDGESLDGLRNVKPPGKRANAVAFEQSSPLDGGYAVKESDDSAVFRLGVKSQAYARRNRSRSVRDGSNAGSTDLIPSANRSSVVPSSCSNPKNVKGLLREKQVDDHAAFVSNSKPASPNGNVVSRASPSTDQLEMEVDGIQMLQTAKEAARDGLPECAIESNPSLNLQGQEPVNQDAQYSTDPMLDGAAHSSDAITKGAVPVVHDLVPVGNIKDNHSAGIVSGISEPDKNAIEAQDCVFSGKSHEADAATEELSLNNTNLCHIESIAAADGSTNDDQCLPRTDNKLDRNHGDPLVLGTHAKPIEIGSGENTELLAVGRNDALSDKPRSAIPNPCNSEKKDGWDLHVSKCDKKNDVELPSIIDDAKLNGEVAPDNEKNAESLLGDGSSTDRNDHIIAGTVSSSCLPSNPINCPKGSLSNTELENGVVNQSKLSKKAHEDAILKEARIIEANIKRAGELPISTVFSEKQKKCHWDYVLEEMSWMANDFVQERAWKITAASKVSYCIASGGLSKFWSENMYRKQLHVARTLAKAIMRFWHSAEVSRTSNMAPKGIQEGCMPNLSTSTDVDGVVPDKDQDSEFIKESSVRTPLPVQDYAVRFLEYTNGMSDRPILPEAPTTPERIYDTGILEMSWEDHLSEENLFYNVPYGAMQAYRESIESLWLRDKRSSNSMHQEDCEASVCDSVADVHHENTYEEEEGETGTYILPGTLESGGSSKFNIKKRKIFPQKSYGTKLYETGANLSGEPCLDSRIGNQPLTLIGKRPSGALNVGSIPTKRMRTAARQRFLSPFSTTPTGGMQLNSKTDVSSGDTSSYQDEQSSMHAGSQCRKNLEVESTMDYDRQLPYDNSEISTKHKKKKKPKHLGYKNSLNLADANVLVVPGKGFSYEQRLQVDPMMQHEQNAKKRLENPHFESNGSTGLYIQHAAKKPKLLKQLPDASSDAITPMTGSMTSPVASQMSNMSNSNKLIKIIANRDRGRKHKATKMTTGQSGSRNPWAAFEDQALVVLVHDLGPNWELVSDAINSTLQFKLHYIFRKPKECKERHKALMDRSAGDGADSAEDSGSSQPYPSTLPGIPKGSARQLFQRLQGPMEEDTLKVHFEKIILIRQQRHSCRSQNDGQEMKQIVPAHNSHVVALSQVIPNNLSGGILTPLDLCDSITSSPDVTTLGYQGSHTSGLAIPSHPGSVTPVLPTTSANNVLQTSPGMVLCSGLPSPSNPLSAASRDAQRYSMPRSVSLPVDEQQRMQYTQMLSGRNVQQSGLPVPGNLPVDRGVRMLPGTSAMGMMCGMNRGMPSMPRPGFQGINSPGMLNMVSTSAMLSGNGVTNPVTAHQGNSMLRPHDTMHMLRPGQSTEEHRQMMQELQMQVSQGSGQTVGTFNGMSGPFSNASVSPPVQTFPVHQHQQPHLLGNPHAHIQGSNHSSPQQQAYAIRYPKDRQLQQRILPQPQASFPSSNAISPIQNSSQIQQQTQSSTPVGPSAQGQHKQQQMPRNPQPGCGLPNQVMKQRQRPQVHQQPRNLQQQRQPPQQQAKLIKGLGRGAMMMHQNLPVDASHVNGLTAASKNQVPEKHLMQQSQGFYSGNSGLNPSLPQQPGQPKIFSRPLPQPAKQISSVPSQSESGNQGQVQVSSTHSLLASQQPTAQPSLPLPAQPPLQQPQQQQQQQQRQTNHSKQTMQRMVLPQNRQMTSDGQIQSSSDPVQVESRTFT
ncbi:Nucleoplasmin ATPase protein [Dioscorea alata]|uniref:Nucleoplasmin ATPase protein n=2 Tax=Dioscorea alata TaxID=55571 RepID=A0ACB7VVV7_DIOAL|nr:Nucleoplasmin ATPase protein [Dioscorea alata]KAH7679083.1 Nucleoplasmin ATPase protein [Dioscorea alata]